MPNYPKYSYPFSLLLQLAGNVFFGGRRSFRDDSRACIQKLEPPLKILGAENIPQSGPCLVTFNHYYRPGFDAWWMALALAAVVPQEMHFVMTGELTFPGKWFAPLGQATSRWLLRRLAGMYGFTRMPPMPPRPKDVEQRAHAVRKTLEYALAHPQAIIGLAPEGGDQPGGLLSLPYPGAGRFIGLLAGMGFDITPMGAFEEQGAFCLSFGETYRLPPEEGSSPNERDQHTANMVMQRIASQLPESLRGVFS